MKTLGSFDFPETPEEAADWTRTIFRHALASRVLVVATTRIEGEWKAYADAVLGHNHDNEEEAVLDHGDQLPEQLARAIFPVMREVPYAR